MPNFSERYGYSAVGKAFQREFVSEELRIKIWNILKISIWDEYYQSSQNQEKINFLIRKLWFNFFNRDLDSIPSNYMQNGRGSYDQLKDYFFNCSWNNLYDFLEYLAENDVFSTHIIKWINETLEQYNSAYRFVGMSITEVTDENEITAIEDGLTHPENAVREHLSSALIKLSDKEDPDYRNSIKESISAVEAACRILTGNKSATLGDALKKANNLHPVMKLAFDKLYGYTSDASGVRHSLIDEPSISYADAKFMLVTCSAFVSYLNTNLTE
jgi:hypothetical protein